MISPPTHDKAGLHILDPKDKRGHKSRYITFLQKKALRRYLPTGTGKLAVDIGCGYGRLTPILAENGWYATGIDPAPELLQYARQYHPGIEFCEGGLPHLPLELESASILLLQNVLRALRMMGRMADARGIGRYVEPGGRVLLVENIRAGHRDFVPETEITDLMHNEGLRMIGRIPIRAGRWWVTYLIRYGLIPESWFDAISDWELDRMAKRHGSPHHQYWNVLFIFEKER